MSVHSGQPTNSHGIRRLGATRVQRSPQVWHAVAKEGYTWGVWGAMNAPMGDPRGCLFFMPDPWSFEEACLSSSSSMTCWRYPRYAARNYLEFDYKEAFFQALRLVRFFAPPSHWPLLARFCAQGPKAMLGAGAGHPYLHDFTGLSERPLLRKIAAREPTRPLNDLPQPYCASPTPILARRNASSNEAGPSGE